LSNLHKIGKYGKGKRGKIINKIRTNRNFHIVSITVCIKNDKCGHKILSAE